MRPRGVGHHASNRTRDMAGIRPPADRTAPACPHVPHCVGCQLIGRAYSEQLRYKHERVAEAFRQFSVLAHLEIPAVIGAPHVFGYRNQAKLVVRQARRGLLLGIYRPGSHQVVDIRQCPVHHPQINRVLAVFGRATERLGVSIYDERTQSGALRYVVVRVSNWTRQVQVILVTRDRLLPHARELVRILQQTRSVVSVVQNVNPDPGNVIFGPTFVPLTRQTALIERVGFLKLKTTAGAFLQANIGVARKLYELALRWVAPQPAETGADLYCGVGALTFHLATAARLVVGMEASPIATANAKENVRLNGFHNVRFHCGAVATELPLLAQRLGPFAFVALNPPRKGVDEAARMAIHACAPQRIVYVSCEPHTLARDLDDFSRRGYRPVCVQPFDLLPQTEHVECVALLSRSG